MPLLNVLTAPNPRLNERALPVDRVDIEIQRLMDDLQETMYVGDGVGLAATQVGINKRVLVIDLGEKNSLASQVIKMANPQLIWVSENKQAFDEGCLSIPDYYAKVSRSALIKVEYINEDDKKKELEAEGLLATCIQHEIDHLNGVLFIDHLSALKRSIILRKIIKDKKYQE